MALTVVSQLDKVIYIDLYYFEEYKILAGIFAYDVDCLINRIQVADKGYKARHWYLIKWIIPYSGTISLC